MMNAVGELVINRTRMLGTFGRLEKLADVLNFSKARMSDKVTEFQEKHEFSKIGAVPAQQPMHYDQFSHGISQDSYPFRGGYSSYTHSYDQSLADFSELEMDRYDDFNILSRSLTEISADITEVSNAARRLRPPGGFRHRMSSPSSLIACRMRSPRRAWCPSAICTPASRAPSATPPRPAASMWNSRSTAPTPNWTTTSFSRSRIRWSTLCEIRSRTD